MSVIAEAPDTAAGAGRDSGPRPSRWRTGYRTAIRGLGVLRRRAGVVGAWFWLMLIALLAVLAPILPLADPAVPVGTPNLAPGARWPEFMGTDQLGRSVLSRLIDGARPSLMVALISVGLALVVGGMLGLVAGYRRRHAERVITVFIDATLAFPPLMLLMALAAVLTPSLWTLGIALAIVFAPSFARLARAATLRLASQEFVLAARSAGASRLRVMIRELLPSVVVPLLSYAFVVMAMAVVAEGSLSFLGLGIPPPAPSWGGMVASGRDNLREAPLLVFIPAAVLLLTVLSLNAVGHHLQQRTGNARGANL
ncbi:ABC transporter permease subunit [Actinomadura sp. LD22]|uniref:ABC transporter permease subunit n=1 Tax=Actinomadura physcomitrii TaxID=2650748 RepID=A0A6I4MF37_9ACTN|nr:ABC transporter permease [Actinomadura physcomitrii]MWA04818.1 ABC transporter permease subunit [Actinomadura physcomitrii]